MSISIKKITGYTNILGFGDENVRIFRITLSACELNCKILPYILRNINLCINSNYEWIEIIYIV